jgi:hypothetical protein
VLYSDVIKQTLKNERGPDASVILFQVNSIKQISLLLKDLGSNKHATAPVRRFPFLSKRIAVNLACSAK